MAKTVRLADIAQKCGVSTVTVSKALSGQKGVSKALRSRIIELADEMGYVKSTSRTDQKERKSYTIGVIVAERFLTENQSLYWSLYQEISKLTLARNCFCILEVISPETETRAELPKVLQEKKINGLIALGQFSKNYLPLLSFQEIIPMIFLDSNGGGNAADCIVPDNLAGGKRMTDYLFSQGHTRIGFVGTLHSAYSIDARYLGYFQSLMEHGVKVREDWIIDDRDRETGIVDKDKYFKLPAEMPTAFFCNSDSSACMFIRKLKENGYKVPSDISVAGFNNYVSEGLTGIDLTTYEINIRDLASRAIHILLSKMEETYYLSGMFVLPGKFIEGSSVSRI